MKIRTGFVTNSSSSSFTLSLKINLKDGKTLKWEGDAYEEECEYEYLDATLSPQNLARSRSIASLVKKLEESVTCGYDGEEEVLGENTKFIRDIKNLSGMGEIETISVEGIERYDLVNKWGQFFEYNRKTKKYTCKYQGGEWGAINGASGGQLYVPDAAEAETIEFEVTDGVYRYFGTGEKEVIVPDGLGITKIGKFTFTNTVVERVVLPEGVKTIGEGAFLNSQLKQLVLPASVTKIEESVFDSLSKKPTIVAPEGSFAQAYAEKNGFPFKALK